MVSRQPDTGFGGGVKYGIQDARDIHRLYFEYEMFEPGHDLNHSPQGIVSVPGRVSARGTGACLDWK